MLLLGDCISYTQDVNGFKNSNSAFLQTLPTCHEYVVINTAHRPAAMPKNSNACVSCRGCLQARKNRTILDREGLGWDSGAWVPLPATRSPKEPIFEMTAQILI